MKVKLTVALLLLVFFFTVLTSVSTKSPVCDAAGHHIASGYSYAKTGNFWMNQCTPPLLRILMGLPLLTQDLKFPVDHPSWAENNSTSFSYQFLFVYNSNANRIVFLSRLPMILFSVVFGLFIFIWAKRLYGQGAGLFALFLYVFSPAILGNAGLAMLDAGCAFFMFLACFQFWRYLKRKTFMNLVLAGVCFGLAQSAKHTAVVLFPLFLIFIVADFSLNRKEWTSSWKAIGSVLVIWIIGIFVLWATYLFEFKPLLVNVPDVEGKIEYIRKFSGSVPFIDSKKLSDSLVYFAEKVPIPLSTYIVSLLGVIKTGIVGQRLVFMGRETFEGSKIYYLVDYLIKTPLPVLIMLLFSVLSVRRRSEKDPVTNLVLLLPVFVVFGFASFSKVQGGLRYILPMYPFLFVWISDIVNVRFGKVTKVFKGVLLGLGAWFVVVSFSVYPHYLTYFNEIIGGPGGTGYKVTTDMDWGQDFMALRNYLDENDIRKVRLYCFGTVEPGYYGIEYEEIDNIEFEEPVAGSYYAISSRFLGNVKWAKDYKPVDRIANTIFVYYIEEEKE